VVVVGDGQLLVGREKERPLSLLRGKCGDKAS
jgi:hypothetical protein